MLIISPNLDMLEPEDCDVFTEPCAATSLESRKQPSPWVDSQLETASSASSSTGASVPATRHLHIAIFDTEKPPVIPPSSPDAFQEIMNRTTNRLFGSNLRLHWTVYNVRNNPLPSDNAFLTIHAVMITGSSSRAYCRDAWILNLATRIRTAYRYFPHVKWYGSDFGHQIICDALLAEWGYQTGSMYWHDIGKYAEVGIETVLFRPRFRAALKASEARTREATAHLLRPTSESPDQGHESVPTLDEVLDRGYMSLRFAHTDQVWPPHNVAVPMYIPGVSGVGQHRDDFPLPFIRELIYQVGFNRLCGVQGMYLPTRIFTLQGRMELDQATAVASVVKFMEDRAYGPPDVVRLYLERARQLNDGEDNRGWIAERVLWFFLSEPQMVYERGPAVTDIVNGIIDDNDLSVLDRVRSGLIHPSRVERTGPSTIRIRLDGGHIWLPIPTERPEQPVDGEQAGVVADDEHHEENNEQPADDDQPEQDDEQPEQDDEQPEQDDEQPEQDDEQPEQDDEQPEQDDEQPEQDDEQPEGSDRMAAYLGAAFSIVRWTIRGFIRTVGSALGERTGQWDRTAQYQNGLGLSE